MSLYDERNAAFIEKDVSHYKTLREKLDYLTTVVTPQIRLIAGGYKIGIFSDADELFDILSDEALELKVIDARYDSVNDIQTIELDEYIEGMVMINE